MLCYGFQKALCGVVKQQNLPFFGGISRLLLSQHLNHHVVGGFVDKRNHDLLAVDGKIARRILFHGRLGNLPHKIPGKGIGKGVAKSFHIGFVDIAGFCGAHVGNGIVMSPKGAFLQKAGNNFLRFRRVKGNLAASETVFFVCKQLL